MNRFTEHPNENGMTYGVHMYESLANAARLILSALALIIHSVFPWLLKDYPGTTAIKAYDNLLLEKRSVNIQKLMLQNLILKRTVAEMTNEMCPEEAKKILQEIRNYDFD